MLKFLTIARYTILFAALLWVLAFVFGMIVLNSHSFLSILFAAIGVAGTIFLVEAKARGEMNVRGVLIKQADQPKTFWFMFCFFIVFIIVTLSAAFLIQA